MAVLNGQGNATSSLHAPHPQSFDRAARLTANRDSTLRRLLALADACAAFAALALALVIAGRPAVGHRLLWGLAALPLIVVLFKLYGLYDRDVKRISHTTVDDVPWIFHAAIGGTLLLWLYSKATSMGHLGFAEVMLFGLGVMILSLSGRFFVRNGLRGVLGTDTALLVGGGQMADALITKLTNHPEYGSKVIGVLRHGNETREARHGLPHLGSPDELSEVAALSGASRVFLAGDGLADSEMEELLRQCRELSLKVSLLPQLSSLLGPSVEIDDVEGVMVLGVNPPWLPRSSRALKRALDLTVAGTLLLLTTPLFLLLALLVKLDSRGPLFFSQVRIGRRGKPFRVFKFRSMVVDAEAQRAALLAQSKDPNWLHLERDPRITRLGNLLRRSSLDELPQLVNVIRGEMSLVGPRPLIPAEDEQVLGWARGRLDLTPGITGYWQVLGRTRIPFDEMVKLDYLYVMNWSLWEDVRLILRTLPAVVGGRGVN